MVKGNSPSGQRFKDFLVIDFLWKVVRDKDNDIHIPGEWQIAQLVSQEPGRNWNIGI